MGLTQVKFAAAMGLAQATVNRWESGETAIEKSQALLIQAVHGVREAWLLTGERPVWVESLPVPRQGVRVIERPVLGASFISEEGFAGVGPMDTMYPLRVDYADLVLQGSGGGDYSDLFFWLVEGRAMARIAKPGELALLNCSKNATTKIVKGGVYLISRHKDESTARLRRLWPDETAGVIRATAENSAYPGFELPLDPKKLEPLIWGRVCCVHHYLLGDDLNEGDW